MRTPRRSRSSIEGSSLSRSNGDQHAHGLAHRFLRRVAEQTFCPPFQAVMIPSKSLAMIASLDDSTIAARRCAALCASWRCSSSIRSRSNVASKTATRATDNEAMSTNKISAVDSGTVREKPDAGGMKKYHAKKRGRSGGKQARPDTTHECRKHNRRKINGEREALSNKVSH